jgi:alpha-mannosidase
VEATYEAIAEELEHVIETSLLSLVGPGTRSISANAGPFAVDGIPPMAARPATADAGELELANLDGGGATIRNDLLGATFDARGHLVSLIDLTTNRELIATGQPGNVLELFVDTPREWDAWDIDDSYRNAGTALTELDALTIAETNDGRGAVSIERSFGASRITETISLRPGSPSLEIQLDVDWHERQKMLKLVFPFDVHAPQAASEIQFGHVMRPTHANTSWDAARFETCAHRWVHVGEPDYGVAIANDRTYGHDIRRTKAVTGTTTTVGLSILRAPLFPDPNADCGRHAFRFSVRPGATIADAVSEGYRLNLPLREVSGADDVVPLICVDNPAIVIEAVKLAEDGSGDVVVRMYESLGGRAGASVHVDFDHTSVTETDLLERPLESPASTTDGRTRVDLRPFQIVTLRIAR